MSLYVPPFNSEFPDTRVTDCVPSSGVMGANKQTHGRYASTVQTREALQNAMGTQDQGATAVQLSAGLFNLWQIICPPGTGWANIAAALANPAKGVAVFGDYQKLPLALREHGNQPTFNGGHCIYAQYASAGKVTVGDPLAASYTTANLADLEAYSRGLGELFVVFTEPVTPTALSYRLSVTAGTYTLWHVERFTHRLYAPRQVTFSRTSSTPVVHGAPGFWLTTDNKTLAGYYWVAGKSTRPFTVTATYSDGSKKAVNPAS